MMTKAVGEGRNHHDPHDNFSVYRLDVTCSEWVDESKQPVKGYQHDYKGLREGTHDRDYSVEKTAGRSQNPSVPNLKM